MDEVGQPGGAEPGRNGGQPADDAFVGRSGVSEVNGAHGHANGRAKRDSGSMLRHRSPEAATPVAAPISPAWRVAQPHRMFDGASDHAQLLASLRVARATIGRAPAGNAVLETLTEDTIESYPLPTMDESEVDVDDNLDGETALDDGTVMPLGPNADGYASAGDESEDYESENYESEDYEAAGRSVEVVESAGYESAGYESAGNAPPDVDVRPSVYDAIPRGHAPHGNGTPVQQGSLVSGAPAMARVSPGGYGNSVGYRPVPPADVPAPVEAESATEPPPPGLVPLLPHRIPAPPDVPDVPDDGYDDFDADDPELDRIASRLRDDEALAEPPADLDVTAVLEAVRKVPGVADAQLRGNPGGMHTLRLDLADGADPGRVSRQVARLLKERMGLAAEPRRARATEPGPTSAATVAPGVRPPFPRPRPATLTDVTAGGDATARADSAVRGDAARSDSSRPETAARGDAAVRAGGPRAEVRSQVTTHTGPAAAADARLIDAPPRVTVDQVRVSTLDTDATVEVRLLSDGVPSVGAASGPAVDGYLLRLAAQAAASAIDGLVEASPTAPQVRCFVDHAGVVPFGSVAVAVVVVLITGAGWVEQLVGSALVGGDPRQAIVRATLAAVNRRLESLLA